MPFDLSTAKPISQGFDLSTAKPVGDQFDLESFDPAGEQVVTDTPKPEPDMGDQLKAIGETLLTLGTGATGGTVGGISGTLEQLAKEISSGEFGTPEAAERVAENAALRAGQLTNLPESELGQKRVKQVGEALAPLQALSPLAVQMGAVGRAAAPALRTGATTAKQTGRGLATIQGPAKRALAREIQAGTVSAEAAKLKLKPPRTFHGEPTGIERFLDARGPKLAKDSLAAKAVTQGFDEGVIQPLKMSSKTDKAFMTKMTGIMDRIQTDRLFGMKNRPGDVAGDVLMSKVRVIRDANKRAGKAIDSEVRKLGNKKVNVAAVGDKLLEDLKGIGINRGSDGKLDFTGSTIEFQGGPKSTIRNIFKRLNDIENPTALDVHNVKRLIDSEVTYGKSLKGLAGEAERALKSYRNGLDEVLDSTFPQYNKANVAYAETITALNDLQAVAGKKMDLIGPNADKATGTLMRRLMSNAQSRVILLDAIDGIEAAVKKHGGSDLIRIKGKGAAVPDNLEMLVLYADELDNVFGPAARTSLQGQFDQALKQGARAATTKSGAVDVGLGLAGKGIEKIRGINKPNAIKAIKKLLDEE